jgi:hypothetical protein
MASRRLAYGEKFGSLWSSEKGRDRADARRQIEGLSLADAQVQLLAQISDQMNYLGQRLWTLERMMLDFMNVYMSEHAPAEEAPPPPPPPV